MELTPQEEQEVAQYEDLHLCANSTTWTIALQVRRIQEAVDRAGDGDFVLQPVSDVEFLILSLDRLLALARRIDLMSRGGQSDAILEFDRALPNLRKVRNVISHVDEYIQGNGRDRAVHIGSLFTCVLDPSRLIFADVEFDLSAALRASEQLFASIRQNPPVSYCKATEKAKVP